MAIDRTLFNLWVDDDGSNTVGKIINKAAIANDILTPIDTALASAGGVDVGICEGRLTLTTLVPVTTADVTAATNVYWTPYRGEYVALYDGASWVLRAFAETTLALGTVTSGLPYDIFAYDNAGTLALEKLAWTNGTTRATALVLQDGVLSKTGALTRRYLGTIYTTSTTTTEDSDTKRFVWNFYNRHPRKVFKTDATANYTYTTATVRQARADSTNQIEVIIGVAEDPIDLTCTASPANSSTGYGVVGIGEDSTSAIHADCVSLPGQSAAAAALAPQFARLIRVPAVGYHYYAWLEYAQAVGTMTWYNNGWGPANLKNSGLFGTTRS